MTRYRTLVFVVLVAVVHGLFFIWYERPEWDTSWLDQVGYRQLGEALATTGKFTKAPDAPTFVPEVIRTPVYPLFLAAIYKVAGPSHLAVALAQTLLFAATCLLVFATTRLVTRSDGIAVAAAVMTALFAPLPYFAALVLTDRKSTRLNSSHVSESRMPSSA